MGDKIKPRQQNKPRNYVERDTDSFKRRKKDKPKKFDWKKNLPDQHER